MFFSEAHSERSQLFLQKTPSYNAPLGYKLQNKEIIRCVHRRI